MKVLLISHPPQRLQKPDFPPIGIAYVGAAAHAAGHEIQLIDGSLMRLPQIIREARKLSPDVIGVTCWTIDRRTVWELCAALKEVLPQAFLVLGGRHASLFPEHVFQKTHAAAVVVGEGEETFRELLSTLEANGELKPIRGLVLRKEDGNPCALMPRPSIEDLDSIPHPLYGGIPHFSFSQYGGFPALPPPTASIISSRGCIFDCTFCGASCFWGRRWRRRSAQSILEEIEWLLGEMRVKSLFFFDDNFPVDKERVTTICQEIIRRGWNLQWSCCSHVKMLNRELLALMRRSGCVSIDFGVESGSEKILQTIRKQQSQRDIERTFTLAHETGIKPRAYLMVGNPGEDETTIDETIEMIGHIKPWASIAAALLILLPGTAVYREAVKNGFISDDFWLKSDDTPLNLQERSHEELVKLRRRLMLGIARQKGNLTSILTYYLKDLYYEHPRLSIFRSLIPRRFR